MRASRDFPVRGKAAMPRKKRQPVAALPPLVRTGVCAYCGSREVIHRDHVVPRSFRRIRPIPPELQGTVESCGPCNWRKANRRLIPPSWEDKLPALEEAFPGAKWRIWDGSTDSPAYREVWI